MPPVLLYYNGLPLLPQEKRVRKLKQEALNAVFTKVYEETYDAVLRYIVCHCASPSDICDLVQNTYLALYQRMRRPGEAVRDPQHYVMRIARNELYRHYGATGMLRNYLPIFSPHDGEADFDAVERELLDTEAEPDDCVLCDEIWEFLSHGDPLTFRIFILYFSQDLGLKEIAQLLHINENTVKSRLYRTLKKLKETFQWQEEESLHETKRSVPSGD